MAGRSFQTRPRFLVYGLRHLIFCICVMAFAEGQVIFLDKQAGGNQRHKKGTGASKGAVIILMLLSAVMIIAVAAFGIAGKNRENDRQVVAASPPSPTVSGAATPQQADQYFTAIVEAVNTESYTMQLCNVENSEVLLLDYSSATDIRDKYGRQIVAGQLDAGDIVKVGCDGQARKAVAVSISDEIWEFVGQTGIGVAENRNIISSGDYRFTYSESLHVLDGTEYIKLKDILRSDTVTLRGIGTEVYVVLLTRGHGYLSFLEYEDYLGGSLLINRQFVSQITEDMSLTLTEGSYRVTVEKDDLSATIEKVVVKRNETTTLDLTPYARVPEPTGQVTFQISPAGALLFVDGENTYYGEPVSLDYGAYEIRVESGGYVAYNGTIHVNSATMTVSVSLPETQGDGSDSESTEGEGEIIGSEEAGDPSNSNTDSNGSGQEDTDSDNTNQGDANQGGSDSDNTSENNNSSDGSYPVDKDHFIIIYSDDEVEVYLDGDYMGVTEDGQAMMEKFIGSFTLELIKGDETKSYIIQVDDDGEDFIFRRYFE